MSALATRSGRPRVCLTGGWFSSDNVGDHAMLCGVLDALHDTFEDPDVWVITAGADKVRSRYGLEAYAPKRRPLGLLRALAGSDLLVFTGGTPFYDDPVHMTYYATVAHAAAWSRVPTAVFGVSLRTVQRPTSAFMLRRILSTARIIGAREQRSLAGFGDVVGDSDPRVVFVPDAAFWMRPAPPEDGARVLAELGIPAGAPVVGVSLRDFRANAAFQQHHYSRRYGADTIERLRDAVSALVEHIVGRHGAHVALLPMHTIAPDDDREVMRAVLERCAPDVVSGRVHVLEQQLDPRTMKAVLGQMRATVGVRFHSLVLSMSMAVPSLAIAYAAKNLAIMEQMGQDAYGVDLNVVDAATLIERFDDLMTHRAQVRAHLAAANEDLASTYRRRLDVLRGLVELPPRHD